MTRWAIFGDNQFSHTKSLCIFYSIGLTTLAQILNGYDICLALSNCQDSRCQILAVILCLELVWPHDIPAVQRV